uniref:Charged multivesicular body protein 2A n=1 Tax=Nothoprocta perdicaria TaxID=30464 RepID=A0A8C6YIT9_NOTPE
RQRDPRDTEGTPGDNTEGGSGHPDAVKIMAKDLVRTRRYIKKFITMRANVQAVALKIQTLKSNNSMAQAMKGVTKAMATMNRQLKLPQIQKIMMEFEKQAEIMDMKEELMSDAIDDAMGDEDDEEEREGTQGPNRGSVDNLGTRGHHQEDKRLQGQWGDMGTPRGGQETPGTMGGHGDTTRTGDPRDNGGTWG